MNLLQLSEVTLYVEEHIGSFHTRRLDSLRKLKLEQILKRKNPYLFRAKNVSSIELVKGLLDEHLSSQEETIFGEFLEGLAIYVCSQVYGGKKSSAEGIDLEFEKDNTLYIVAIKSGPNWGNSSQVKRMLDNFKKAQRILRSSGAKAHIVSVNGCCYGRDSQPDKGDYQKYCGQVFWHFISGNEDLYVDIIEPLGRQARRRNDEFADAYEDILRQFTRSFIVDFCLEDGKIDWQKLVRLNSAKSLD